MFAIHFMLCIYANKTFQIYGSLTQRCGLSLLIDQQDVTLGGHHCSVMDLEIARGSYPGFISLQSESCRELAQSTVWSWGLGRGDQLM